MRERREAAARAQAKALADAEIMCFLEGFGYVRAKITHFLVKMGAREAKKAAKMSSGGHWNCFFCAAVSWHEFHREKYFQYFPGKPRRIE